LLLKGFVLRPADRPKSRNPWAWIPSLYLAEGIPYALVTSVSVVLYKLLHVPNRQIAFYTSLLGLPWVLKPLWSPVVGLVKTRRLWIWTMQLAAAAGFIAVVCSLPLGNVLLWTVPIFLVVALASASHDIAADGFYMLANSEGEQSFFSGVRNTFYRLAMICIQGPLLVLAGTLQKHSGNTTLAWQIAIAIPAAGMALLAAYHWLILPSPEKDKAGETGAGLSRNFMAAFEDFLQKPNVALMILFLLSYRLGEALLLKMVQPFLLDPRADGGLGLEADQVGWVYGTIGIAALLVGGIAGGVLISRRGLRACLWPMVIIMHAPDAVFVYLSSAQPHSLGLIGSCIAIEQFGYGFGFSAYMLYMIYIARGNHKTAHYAICTGFMALGVMLPGMCSGWLQEHIGYQHFFLCVLFATIPGFIMTALVPLDRDFGKRTAPVNPS